LAQTRLVGHQFQVVSAAGQICSEMNALHFLDWI
jgi:hypothetical protein